MSAENIYDKLRAAGMTHAGACGTMGNLMAESNMIANIAQRGMTDLTDAEYTAKFDRAPETCYRDGVGYGLAQWTFWSRKQGLFEFAYSRGQSVGDEETQVDFAIHELRTEYSGLWKFLCSTDDIYSAAERVCKEYERPAVNNVARRYEFALVFDKDFGNIPETPESSGGSFVPPDQSILILQAVLVANGYNTEITGHKNAHFLGKLKEFVADIGG